jgi:diadenosine tetraphosphate (Ap4A) HIT family hydrolase
MNTIRDCRFCDIIEGEYLYNGIDQPFISNDSFIAVASIGALIEGWTLVIPKDHQLSMRGCYNKTDFVDFVRTIMPLLHRRYGTLVAFEHGSNKEGSITACGTDHAHLHFVPMRESLIPDLQNSNLKWVQCPTSEIASRTRQDEYLFYCDFEFNNHWKDPIGYLHILEHPISQYFRHLIANRIGNNDKFDYKKFPYIENAKQTRRTLVEAVS